MCAANRSGTTPSHVSELRSPAARRSPTSVDLMTQVSIDIREAGERHVVVAIAGEIDLATAPVLEGALRWYTECDVIVDLSAVRLLDASGLTALIRAQKRLRRTGHTLRTTGETRHRARRDEGHRPRATRSMVASLKAQPALGSPRERRRAGSRAYEHHPDRAALVPGPTIGVWRHRARRCAACPGVRTVRPRRDRRREW